ncbi:MAG: hypothetical protein AB4372_10235 [Xenococcus sp. (in: cyanobacteria)]
MKDNITFIVKIFILSSILSVVIKYGGQLLSISPTVAIAIAAIFLPSMIVALALTWRSRQQFPNN